MSETFLSDAGRKIIRYSLILRNSQFSGIDRHASRSLYYSVSNNGKNKNVKEANSLEERIINSWVWMCGGKTGFRQRFTEGEMPNLGCKG